MRMRKLGSGHSLAFFAPPEVHQGILALAGKALREQVTSMDVIRWSISQTCQQAEKFLQLLFSQGYSFVKRRAICDRFMTEHDTVSLLSDVSRFNEIWEELREDDARSLQDMYGLNRCYTQELLLALNGLPDDPLVLGLKDVGKTLDLSGASDAAINEEQEREL